MKTKKALLLSIDGGGVRGKIATVFLAHLEQELNRSLFDTFDFFAGTSTGALIVLGITANKFSGQQLDALYTIPNLRRIFKKPFFGILPYYPGAKYIGEGKRELFTEIFGQKQFLDIPKPTLVTAYDFVNTQAVVFKSSGGSDSDYGPTVVEVADATTAAPTYFPSVVTSAAKPRNLIDGGVAATNPSLCLVSEVLKHGYSLDEIGLVSIGSGQHSLRKILPTAQNWGSLAWIQHGLIDDFMLGDSSLTQYQCKMLLDDNYLRADGLLAHASEELDDITPENLSCLYQVGATMYQTYRRQILKMLN